jgi:drug/metabolite transporter (DMT)-like permease
MGQMKPFEFLAIAFVAVGVMNIFLIHKRGWRAVGLALAAALCAAACYLWEKDAGRLPTWLLAGAAGVFLATVLYEAGRKKMDPK